MDLVSATRTDAIPSFQRCELKIAIKIPSCAAGGLVTLICLSRALESGNHETRVLGPPSHPAQRVLNRTDLQLNHHATDDTMDESSVLQKFALLIENGLAFYDDEQQIIEHMDTSLKVRTAGLLPGDIDTESTNSFSSFSHLLSQRNQPSRQIHPSPNATSTYWRGAGMGVT